MRLYMKEVKFVGLNYKVIQIWRNHFTYSI